MWCGVEWVDTCGSKMGNNYMAHILFFYVAMFGFAFHLLVLSPPPFIHLLFWHFYFVLFCGNFLSIKFILFIHFFYSYIFSNQLDLGLFLCYLI
jgi:hypothetical protein